MQWTFCIVQFYIRSIYPVPCAIVTENKSQSSSSSFLTDVNNEVIQLLANTLDTNAFIFHIHKWFKWNRPNSHHPIFRVNREKKVAFYHLGILCWTTWIFDLIFHFNVPTNFVLMCLVNSFRMFTFTSCDVYLTAH